jgi:hypothetical protein
MSQQDQNSDGPRDNFPGKSGGGWIVINDDAREKDQLDLSHGRPHGAQGFREKAEEVRRVAARVGDPESQRTLRQVASQYDRMADRADRQAGLSATNLSAQQTAGNGQNADD